MGCLMMHKTLIPSKHSSYEKREKMDQRKRKAVDEGRTGKETTGHSKKLTFNRRTKTGRTVDRKRIQK